MKRILIFVALFGCACQTPKKVIDNQQLLNSHPKPLKIFGIGNWDSQHAILTLTDGNGSYFVIQAPLNDSLKIGNTYSPY